MSATMATTPAVWINRAMECLWILAVVLVPLAFLGRNYGEWSSAIGSYELPKLTILKTLAGLLAALWLIEWGLRPPTAKICASSIRLAGLRPLTWLAGRREWLSEKPVRWLSIAVLLFLGSTLLSTFLSASFSVSMWGDIPGQDSYSAYTVAAYVLIFGVIATHLNSEAQLWRLLGAVVAVGVLVAVYGIFQHYGHDFLDLIEPSNTIRVSSTLGNATFAGAFLLMTIPVSVTLAAISLRGSYRSSSFWLVLGSWTVLLTVQMLGMVFTLTRGPWFGTIFALLVLLGLTAVFVGWRNLARTILAIGLAVALTSAVLVLTSGSSRGDDGEEASTTGTAAEEVADRISTVGRQAVSGGLGGRVDVWRVSWRLMIDRPWFSFDTLSLSYLRPLIGYGPDFFRETYLLESPPGFRKLPSEPAHAHNYFIHQGVELGFLGVVASLGVFVAVFLVGGYQLIKGSGNYANGHKLLLAALLATLAGRLLEQMVGVARVSDLTLFWVLLGTFFALPIVMRNRPPTNDVVPTLSQPRPSTRTGARTKVGSSLEKWVLLSRLLVVCLVVGIGVLTWTKSINYFRAGLIADQGAQQFREGRLQSSGVSLDRAIQLAPDVSSYYNDRAAVYWACRQSAQEQPGDSISQDKGQSYGLCQPQEQYERNQRWVERRPFNFRSRLALADSTLDLGSIQGNPDLISRSTELYREAVDMIPNGWPLWNHLGAVYIQVGQPDSAFTPLKKSLEITADTTLSYDAAVLQATAHFNLGQLDEAIAKSGEAIRSRNNLPEAYYIRGTSYYTLGQLEEAVKDLDSAVVSESEHGPAFNQHDLAFNNRGLAHVGMGRLDLALEDFSQAVKLNPELALAYNNRGFVHRDLGSLDLALGDLDHAISLDPNLTMAYYNRALTYALLGEDTKAQQNGELAVQLGLDSAAVEAALSEIKGRVSSE